LVEAAFDFGELVLGEAFVGVGLGLGLADFGFVFEALDFSVLTQGTSGHEGGDGAAKAEVILGTIDAGGVVEGGEHLVELEGENGLDEVGVGIGAGGFELAEKGGGLGRELVEALEGLLIAEPAGIAAAPPTGKVPAGEAVPAAGLELGEDGVVRLASAEGLIDEVANGDREARDLAGLAPRPRGRSDDIFNSHGAEYGTKREGGVTPLWTVFHL